MIAQTVLNPEQHASLLGGQRSPNQDKTGTCLCDCVCVCLADCHFPQLFVPHIKSTGLPRSPSRAQKKAKRGGYTRPTSATSAW
ncbi:hypothetical protein PoB_002978700 [Plakobranchus ocellatus]|uniref:Uncharacterized protein n=1 Tax=Plakobranchus ocellatus TaxID=259542 RepID=A0AAV4A8S3_9GAST|nr:hypothetical protein PoB_002978700 [Plakobranchus ocellatus]